MERGGRRHDAVALCLVLLAGVKGFFLDLCLVGVFDDDVTLLGPWNSHLGYIVCAKSGDALFFLLGKPLDI